MVSTENKQQKTNFYFCQSRQNKEEQAQQVRRRDSENGKPREDTSREKKREEREERLRGYRQEHRWHTLEEMQ